MKSHPTDHETAQSAVRNLNGQDVGGRPLRIDLADSDPFLEGKTTVRGELIDSHETRAQWREREQREGRGKDPNAFLRDLPAGVPLPPGLTAMDSISQTLAATNPTQILEVLAQMKVCSQFCYLALCVRHPECPLKIPRFVGFRDHTSGPSPSPPCRPPTARVRPLPSTSPQQNCRPCNPPTNAQRHDRCFPSISQCPNSLYINRSSYRISTTSHTTANAHPTQLPPCSSPDSSHTRSPTGVRSPAEHARDACPYTPDSYAHAYVRCPPAYGSSTGTPESVL